MSQCRLWHRWPPPLCAHLLGHHAGSTRPHPVPVPGTLAGGQPQTCPEPRSSIGAHSTPPPPRPGCSQASTGRPQCGPRRTLPSSSREAPELTSRERVNTRSRAHPRPAPGERSPRPCGRVQARRALRRQRTRRKQPRRAPRVSNNVALTGALGIADVTSGQGPLSRRSVGRSVKMGKVAPVARKLLEKRVNHGQEGSVQAQLPGVRAGTQAGRVERFPTAPPPRPQPGPDCCPETCEELTRIT